MKSYVLILSVGPVQGFIASARRSRDLWAGSWLLSEIAKAAAEKLKSKGATMIFPHADGEKLPESVGNKIQVVLNNTSQDKLIEIANDAKKAANQAFIQFADNVLNKLGTQGEKLRLDIWENQKDDYVEVQYAWVEIENGEYLEATKLAAKVLAARKATRDFEPSKVANQYLPKSSLDGTRETVLPEKYSDILRKKLGLSQSEQLDCTGVVKRLCGNPEQFTPITRVAAHDWIIKVKQQFPEKLQEINDIYEELVSAYLATKVSGNKKPEKDNKNGVSIYHDLPYDAQFLYRSRLEVALQQATFETDKALLKQLKNVLQKVWATECGEPCPYFVLLLADGDRMGELLDKAQSQQNHQEITKNLSAFAESVPATMRQFNAHCIYAGGDDVLGLVPLNQARECAEKLAEKFSGCLKDVADKLGAENPPTLSVGLTICHINTPLGNVRALAKRAEKVAKGDTYPPKEQRDALGITLAVRSGATTDMRLRWNDMPALKLFTSWIAAYAQGKLSSRVAYDCREIFMMTDFPNQNKDDTENLKNIRTAELTRMLKKARTPNGKELDSEIKDNLVKRFHQLNGDLNALATELITARWLAAKTQRDFGRDA
ncbi:type III-B CRISPR-associated protein Cas10/Cmr2 [Kingella negevensis]|uniref:CRISPR-associated protein n=1 Tax=Kingella negevensis TaxID=1522312 RepID=A0A238HID7_9NEIS|nr:type III-B CRISPR-associated protein Cas10/Cmr2 [Kingella negevensis]MDK4681152.1 type III-B CRISPR-associated protein Cas10/Cmr2 [Kingella negevensis]MDK4683355.1 type III-B CRISPR-associated protein Cas10/Cmr2 [Kingella negevensis]MDK4691515.1 type III-B CRISPR-associated protein Cas10/Cmr2 [Kingella negevensis]MDK4693334.1 type III-B CRISPR-associated protein Cas10/Cmr2 [Kingella negevensis]MDK4697625.1 type III-B CRISPR-associated protein Cas10/Cmr2 [Kingella negevensis]